MNISKKILILILVFNKSTLGMKQTQLQKKLLPLTLRYLEGHRPYPLINATWNPNGSNLTSVAGNLILRDADTGEIKKILHEKHGTSSIIFSPNGERMIHQPCCKTHITEEVWLCDGNTGSHIKNLNREEYQQPSRLAFSPDSLHILQSISDYNKIGSIIYIYDAQTGDVLHTAQDSLCSIRTLIFKNNDECITGGRAETQEKNLAIRNKEGKIIEYLAGNREEICTIEKSINGALFATGSGGYNFRPKNEYNGALVIRNNENVCIQKIIGYNSYVHLLSFSIDGKHLAFGYQTDDGISMTKIMDIESGNIIKEIDDKKNGLKECFVFSPHTPLFIIGYHNKVALYNSITYEHIKTLDDARFLALKPDGTCIALQKDQQLVLCQLFDKD